LDFRKAIQFVLGLAITVLALIFFLKNMEWQQVLPILRGVSPNMLILAGGLTILSLYLRGLRWHFLLPKTKGASSQGLFGLCSIGFMVNNLLPARLGEAARIFLLYKRNHYSVHASIGSVLLERGVDSVVYVFFILIPYWSAYSLLSDKMLFTSFPLAHLVQLTLVIGIGLIAVGLAIYFSYARLDRIEGFLQRKASFLRGPLGHLVQLVRESGQWLVMGKQLAAVSVLTLLCVGCYPLILLLLARGVGVHLSLNQALLVAGFLALGAAIPSSPGYVGTLHVACMEALNLFDVERTHAAAIAIIYHLVTWAVTVATGLFFLFKMDLKLSEIRTMEKVRMDDNG